jgi:enamine deaminase RidA (YjgF/YER057c/UK114 family)
MDMRSRRRFVASMMAAAAASPMLLAQQGGVPGPGATGAQARRAGGGGASTPHPAGIVWVSGRGANDGVPADQRLKATDPYEKHCQFTMNALKTGIEALGGTMSDFLYMHVFFCLPLDDSIPTPTGTAANAAYQHCYTALAPIYGAAWQGTKYGAPPRSCYSLEWIPGGSLLEMVGAAYIDPNAAPAARPAAGA